MQVRAMGILVHTTVKVPKPQMERTCLSAVPGAVLNLRTPLLETEKNPRPVIRVRARLLVEGWPSESIHGTLAFGGQNFTHTH